MYREIDVSEATKSHFAVFRAAIALAWADHKLHEEEQERILVYIDNNEELSSAQREQLKKDLQQPIKMDEVWPEITDVLDRAHVINIANTIFWEDGELCNNEKEVYEKIKAAHMVTLDMDFLREDIANCRRDIAARRQLFEQELHDLRGPFSRMMHYLETMVGKVI